MKITKMLSGLEKRNDALQKILAAERPFAEPLLQKMKAYYRIGTAWSSNAIEGNSYTETETKILLEDGITVGGKPFRDAAALVGHAKAYDHIFTLLRQKGITEQDVLKMHAMMGDGLEYGPAGSYRKVPVFISGSAFALPKAEDVPDLMGRFFGVTEPQSKSFHPVVQAAVLHKELVTIHPFADGNGRVARLVMNTVLLQNNFLPIQIYPVQRQLYIDCLKDAQLNKNDKPFIQFILQQEIKAQKDMIRLLGLDTKKSQVDKPGGESAESKTVPKQ